MPSLIVRLFEDPLALSVVGVLLVIQGWSWFRWRTETRLQLLLQSTALTQVVRAVKSVRSPEELVSDTTPPEVAQALHAAYPSGEHTEALDPRIAFDSEQLLPRSYNGRLDAAAPGMFTAIGIIGTFVGLVLAFIRLDFTDAARSIQPLIGGMTIAFVNSLLGVTLSIRWTLSSRRARHRFDEAAHALVAAVERKFSRPAHGTHMLSALVALRNDVSTMGSQLAGAISRVEDKTLMVVDAERASARLFESKLGELHTATRDASNTLLESLAPRLQETFRSLVDLPFEQLGASVAQFKMIVDQAADRNAESVEALEASARALGTAQESLVRATTVAQTHVDALSEGAEKLREVTAATATVVEQAGSAAGTLREAATTLVAVGERNGELADAMADALEGLRSTSGALDSTSMQFREASQRLEQAAGRIERLGVEAADSSLEAVREQLETAIRAIAQSLEDFGTRNVTAYETSSNRIINVLDSRVTDLTDRMSAELQTLAMRLPESASEITNAVGQMRHRLGQLISSLEKSTRALDESSSQALAARLSEYDKMVAQAVDRFSGTLLTWDGKVAELAAAGKDLRAGTTDALRGLEDAMTGNKAIIEAATKAASDASLTATEVQRMLLSLATTERPGQLNSHTGLANTVYGASSAAPIVPESGQ